MTLFVCLCMWTKGKLGTVQKLISPSSSPLLVHNYKGNLWMFNIYNCPDNSTILRMKLTQENRLYTCFWLFLMLLNSTWNKRKKEKKSIISWLLTSPKVLRKTPFCQDCTGLCISQTMSILFTLPSWEEDQYHAYTSYTIVTLFFWSALCSESRVKITGEPTPASQFAVNRILYPKVPDRQHIKDVNGIIIEREVRTGERIQGELQMLFGEEDV